MSSAPNHPRKPVLSIVVTAHAEGILLHRTLRSVLRAARLLDEQNISWEVIIHVDNGTPETLSYIEANQEFLKPFRILHNSFGDLAASRNFSVSKVSGDIITFIDADDLMSERWLADGVTYLRDYGKPAVLHTEWLINFGGQQLAWRKYDSCSKEEDALIMVWANRWDSAVMAPRSVFERFPYAPNTGGFGSEDWHFGSQTLAADIPHRVVPYTVLFARRREESEMSRQQANFNTVHYTDLLDIDFFRNISADKVLAHTSDVSSPAARQRLQRLSADALRRSYRILNRQRVLQPYLEAAKLRVTDRHQGSTTARIPAWLVEEWREMHSIDRQIFPSNKLLHDIPLYISEMYELGVAYYNLVKHITRRPDYIIVVPHIIAGGADLVILNYVRAIQQLHPDWHILVIATDNTHSTWADRLPKSVDFLPWGEVCVASGIWRELHLQLFARLIVQLRCKRLHIIQSALGFEFAAKYRQLLEANEYRVYACAFCEDIDDEGRFIGHIHSGLPDAYPALRCILTDNAAVARQLSWEYGFDPAKFIVHYQPAEIDTVQPPKQSVARPYRILWASRVSTQKRPDIMKQVTERLDPAEFHVDAYGSLHNDFTADFFSGVPGLTYRGTFSGLGSIDLRSYDLFLYTSANDGVPNVLLGITAAGLPIVASAAGGVGEFIIDGRTGMLIDPLTDVETYVRAVRKLRDDPVLASQLVIHAQQLLTSRHSVATFIQNVKGADL